MDEQTKSHVVSLREELTDLNTEYQKISDRRDQDEITLLVIDKMISRKAQELTVIQSKCNHRVVLYTPSDVIPNHTVCICRHCHKTWSDKR